MTESGRPGFAKGYAVARQEIGDRRRKTLREKLEHLSKRTVEKMDPLLRFHRSRFPGTSRGIRNLDPSVLKGGLLQ